MCPSPETKKSQKKKNIFENTTIKYWGIRRGWGRSKEKLKGNRMSLFGGWKEGGRDRNYH